MAGKDSTDEPTVTGSGLTRASILYAQLGEDFVKQLYVEQKPVRSRDRRQYIDWLARGTYPICLNCREYDMRALLKESFPLLEIFELSDVRTGRSGAMEYRGRKQSASPQCGWNFRQLDVVQGRARNLLPWRR